MGVATADPEAKGNRRFALLLRFHLLPCHARSLPRIPTWSKKICELALPRLVRAAWVGLIGSPCGLGRDVP